MNKFYWRFLAAETRGAQYRFARHTTRRDNGSVNYYYDDLWCVTSYNRTYRGTTFKAALLKSAEFNARDRYIYMMYLELVLGF